MYYYRLICPQSRYALTINHDSKWNLIFSAFKLISADIFEKLKEEARTCKNTQGEESSLSKDQDEKSDQRGLEGPWIYISPNDVVCSR